MASQGAGGRCRIGIDVGGTFTDFVLHDAASGRLTYYKEPSVPSDPSLAVARGIVALMERAGVGPDRVELIIHGTTLAINAVIQRQGANVALVVSKGNRDVLEIARCHMPNPYDFTAEKEEPLVARDMVFEISARLAADGSVIMRPEADEVAKIAAALREKKASAVAVMLLHSYLYPFMEREVAAALRKHLDGMLVTESAHIWPERREYERSLIAVLNAYVHPLMEQYLKLLTHRIAEAGIDAPIYITASNGGTLSIATARDRPIETILSGPASGVVAAAQVAAGSSQRRIITFDMGGTSSDIAISKDGEPEYATRTHIGDFPLILPVVSVASIGAGGGSVVWVDRQGVLKVGPHSAGADPGPVCYGRGGTEPTVTDCYLLVGYIHPEHFLGGRMRLDRDLAREALDGIAERLDLAGQDRSIQAAEAALRVATAVMATELQKGLAQRGEDPKSFALMAFGGAGPTHANLLAREARLNTIVVPRAPGTFCAMGAILADVKRDYVRSIRLLLNGESRAEETLSRTFLELEREALQWIDTEGDLLGETVFSRTADMRYKGQAWELEVVIPEELRSHPDSAKLSELFHCAHEKVYAFRDAKTPVEMTTVRLRVTGKMPPIRLPELGEDTPARPIGQRHVYHQANYLSVPVFRRRDLARSQKVPGPAVIEQEDSTTWILPGWAGAVDRMGNLVVSQVP